MSARSDLNTGLRAWILGLSPTTDDKLINSGAKGPRPALPYLSLRITFVGGGQHGPAERIETTDGTNPIISMMERREATVSIQGFGPTAEEWLESLQELMDSPDSMKLQKDNDLSIRALNGISNNSFVIGTQEEDRYLFEVSVLYRRLSDSQTLVPLSTTETTVHYESGSDTFEQTITTP